MLRLQFVVEDDRFDTPQLLFVEVQDEARARELAMTKLAESQHRSAIVVREGDRPIFALARDRIPPPR